MPGNTENKEMDGRIRSFSNWRFSSDPSKLAYAGFYATGYHDLVQCFACGLGLRYLTADDDPLSEHIKNCRSDCSYLNDLNKEHQDPNCFSDEQANMSDAEDDLEQLEEQNATLRERVMCKVCRERSATILLLPCSHLAACVQCGPSLTTCPVCNRRIVETVRTFMG